MSKLLFSSRARLILSSVENGRLLTRINQEATVDGALCLLISEQNTGHSCTCYQLRKTSVIGNLSWVQRIGMRIAANIPAEWLPRLQCGIF